MPAGTPFPRQFVLMLDDGRVVLEWGSGLYQDVYSGDFTEELTSLISHPVKDDELEILKRAGRVDYYNRQQVYFLGLRDRPFHTLD
jgi:hypothetical protein